MDFHISVDFRLGTVESPFAEIIWSNEPLPSGISGSVHNEKKVK